MQRVRARSHGISNAANPDISAPPLSVRHSHHTTAQVPAEVLDAHAPRPSSRLNRALSQPGRTQARPRSAPTPARARSHPPQATAPADLAAQRTNDYKLETSHIYKGGDLKEFVVGSFFVKNAFKVSSLSKVRIGAHFVPCVYAHCQKCTTEGPNCSYSWRFSQMKRFDSRTFQDSHRH